MKYQTIIYERSIKRYDDIQTARVELIVEEGESPHTVMELAQAFVSSELGIRTNTLERDNENLENKKYALEAQVKSLESKVSEASARWEKIKEFFTKHGIEPEGDIPF